MPKIFVGLSCLSDSELKWTPLAFWLPYAPVMGVVVMRFVVVATRFVVVVMRFRIVVMMFGAVFIKLCGCAFVVMTDEPKDKL